MTVVDNSLVAIGLIATSGATFTLSTLEGSWRLIIAAIPAYNEEKTIAKVVVRAMEHVDEVVVIDDGSTDDTAIIAEHLGARVVRHDGNLGYGAAIRSCFSVARDLNSDALVILDADGQHSADDIPKLLTPIQAERRI